MDYRQRHLLPLIMTLLIPVVAFGNIIDLANCSIGTRATEDVSVMVCPGCDGYALSAAQTFGGGTMDATIEVFIRNAAGQGIPDVPADDITIEDPNLCWCDLGNIADFDTDASGYTEFAFAPCMGGCSPNMELGGYVAAEGPFFQNPIPYIKINSLDRNCDLVVNLIDLADFTAAYFTPPPADYCMDFYWDGVMNLLDLAAFSQHYGHECQ
jgi:hypothetical protein